MRRLLLALPLLAALGGCLGSTAPDVNYGSDPTQETFASTLNVDLASMTKVDVPELQRSVWYRDIVASDTGTILSNVQVADTLVFDYTLWLKNGTKVQTSIGSASGPVSLRLRDLIIGWQVGMPGMRAGSTRQLVIPSIMAYGPAGTPDGSIPPNATVVYEVQLHQVKKGS